MSEENVMWMLNDEVRYRSVGDEGVVVHLDSGRVLVVNEVGLHILQHMAKPVTRSELVASITDEFGVDEDRALSDLETYFCALDAERVLHRVAHPAETG